MNEMKEMECLNNLTEQLTQNNLSAFILAILSSSLLPKASYT
jgi:hypothetical protein